MKTKRRTLHNLDQFGLTVRQLAALGSLKVKLRVHLQHIEEKTVLKLTPKQRMEEMKRHYQLRLSRVKQSWRYGPIKINWTRRQPRGFTATVEARDLRDVLRIPEAFMVWIDSIPGRKRAAVPPKEKWFSVQARFAIQVEGQTTGLQSYEDRIVMVRAISFENAEQRLRPEFKRYQEPYLNPYGFMVRFKFERILDSYEIFDERIDPRGVEVFSAFGRRRMKAEYSWRSKRKSANAN